MESFLECTVHRLICVSADLMLYLCLRRYPNIKTTLSQRFVFEWNCNCYFNCQMYHLNEIYTVHNKNEILVQYRATVCDAGPALKHHCINVF